MTRARAEELAAVPQAAPAAPRPTRGLSDRQAAVNAMTGDVKILVGVGALVIVAGLGWMIFGPAPARVTPVLGYVDPGAPKSAKAQDHLRPPFKLPWWK
jgi:hypothetical protein